MALKSLSAIAKEIKVNPSTVSYYLNLGFLDEALVYKLGRKKPLVDSVKAKKLIRQYKNPAYDKTGQFKESGRKTATRAKAQIEQLKAARLKMNLEVSQGKLISKSDVADKAFRAAREARDGLLNIPARTAALVSAESDEKKCREILCKEVKPLMDELERRLMEL